MGVYPTKIMAYCLMPNHWHFLLQPSADNELSSFMGWISNAHTRKYLRSNRTTGEVPLYQGRFKSFPIKCDEHFFVVRRYIERNPIRASLVTKAQDWAWSSIGQDYFDTPKIKLSGDIMGSLGNWLEIVNPSQTEVESQQVQSSIIKEKLFGDTHWCKETAVKLHLELTLRDAGRPSKK
jgi:putative transposase